jgi:multidrug efflux pump subunit AcrB
VNPRSVGRGLAGRIATAGLHSRLTPLGIVVSVLLGALALSTLPREEEPQIQVPMVDVELAWPGTPALQTERQLTTVVERRLWEIPGLEYLYSTSREDGALLIARFQVGFDADEALVRVRTRLDEARSSLPPGAGVVSVSPRSIDDVPVLGLMLWSPKRPDFDHGDLRRVADEVAIELRKTPGVSRVRVLGGERREIRIEPDPVRLGSTGITITALISALESAAVSLPAGTFDQGALSTELRAESPFRNAQDLRELAVGARAGRPVRLSEVATVADGPGEPTNYVFFGGKDGVRHPAVTVEIAKRPGVNATTLVESLHEKLVDLRPRLLGSEIEVATTRDYGATARHKSDDLMFHLMLAMLSVIALIALALGRREALVVAVAIPVTLALTLFLYRFLGYTLNRVTLFALIFSIGILVDDAIVVVENIARHFHMRDSRSLDRKVVEAVDEVGNPTVLATITVIAAILPLAFVGGLMGPYMKPIPVGASLAMLFSLAVAFLISPWAARRVLPAHGAAAPRSTEGHLDRLYRRGMGRLLDRRGSRALFFAGVVLLLLGATSLIALRLVAVKMLPFDNKSEFQVVLDMPPRTPLENTLAVADEMAVRIAADPDVEHFQIYAGLGAPNTFNGLVRHYDLRNEARFASIEVQLVEAERRKAQSHAIAKRVRPGVEGIALRHGARVKVVEVPPGPPVLSTLVAEVYGPELEGQRALARQVWGAFRDTPGVVDTDLLLTEGRPRERWEVDPDRAAMAGVSPGQVTTALAALQAGVRVTTLRGGEAEAEAEAVPVQVRLSAADRADRAALAALRLGDGAGTPLGELAQGVRDVAPPEIHHKNLNRVVYVLGDVAGQVESPVYAIAELRPRIAALTAPDGGAIHQLSTRLPPSTERYALKWDGEWHITYEVFRDMGAAFAIVLVLIYILTVGWFRSFITPFVIMLPIPLSLVGILPLHALLGAFFTATSMIGFIAGAGITVRNSIILVDFIEMRRGQGQALRDAVIDAGAVRFRPMVLTAAAVAVGGAVILFDPIFQGLALSLIGGEIAATLLSRIAVPVLYYVTRRGDVRAHTDAPRTAGDAVRVVGDEGVVRTEPGRRTSAGDIIRRLLLRPGAGRASQGSQP